jgi:fatty-acyl-CoA synthase
LTIASSSLETSYWPAQASTGVRDIALPALLREAAAARPDHLALVDAAADPAARRHWTYRELLQETEAVARALLRRFRPGDRVAIWAPNGAEWVVLQQGIAMAGMVVVAINPAYRAGELEFVLAQSGSVGLFHADSYRGVELASIVEEVRPRTPELREIVTMSGWEDFVASGATGPELPEVQPTDPVQIQYTSGTTGFPKGALLHHKGIVNEAAFVGQRAGMGEDAVCVNAMPMYHIGGGAVTELSTIAAHGTYVVMPGFDAGLTLELFEAYRGTHSLMVPTMLLAVLEHPDRATRDLSTIQTIMSGAAAVAESLVTRVVEEFDCGFSILFGQTEMHGVISQTSLEDSTIDQATTVGQPLPELEVKVIDPDSGDIVAIGQPGEICCRGYQNMLGYFRMPEETAETIDADGWLHMGDIGVMDERGFLRVTGRVKDMIIRGGMNLYPREIEDMLFSHPALAEVAVIGVPDATWGEQVGAVVRLREGAVAPTADELRAWCQQRIAAHKAPTHWYFIDAYPMTPSGKIQKFVLRERIESGELVPQIARSTRGGR